jgi:hypothetical protein
MTIAVAMIPVGMCAAAGSSHTEKTLDSTPNPRVTISNLRGRVAVRGWYKSQVHIIWTGASPNTELDTETYPPNGTAEKIHFVTHVTNPQAQPEDKSSDYLVEVPVGTSLEIRNPDGEIEVDRLRGETAVESVKGDITLADLSGHVSANSIDGNINVLRPSGSDVIATSICGNLHFVSPTAPELRASTNSGDVTYDGDFMPGGEYRLTNYSGNITVRAPESASFDLTIHRVHGKVIKKLDFTPRQHPAANFPSFAGKHNAGDAIVELKTFSGTISILPQ